MTDYLNTPLESFLQDGERDTCATFKVTREYKAALRVVACEYGITDTCFMRDAITFYAALLKIHPDLRNVSMNKIRDEADYVRNILVLLEKV